MDLLWKIFSAVSFDCWRRESSSVQRSPEKPSRTSSTETGSLSGTSSLDLDKPHCQGCITYNARLRRLSCGHLYCTACADLIVNLAFEDIEGLSDYPCPICKSIRQLGDLLPAPACRSTPFAAPFWTVQRQATKRAENRED